MQDVIAGRQHAVGPFPQIRLVLDCRAPDSYAARIDPSSPESGSRLCRDPMLTDPALTAVEPVAILQIC